MSLHVLTYLGGRPILRVFFEHLKSRITCRLEVARAMYVHLNNSTTRATVRLWSNRQRNENYIDVNNAG